MKTLRFIFTVGILMIVGAFAMSILDNGGVVVQRAYRPPRTYEFGVDFWYTTGVIFQWGIYALLAAGLVFGVLWLLGKGRHAFSTQTFYAEDGLLPAVVMNTGGIRDFFAGRTQRTILQLNNTGIGLQHVTIDSMGNMTSHADVAWTADHQLEIAQLAKRVQLAAAMAGGGGLFGRDGVRNKAQAMLALGESPYASRQKPIPGPSLPVEAEEVPTYYGEAPTAVEGLELTDSTNIALGYDVRDNAPYVWNVRKHPHARIHGESQSGKTTMTQTAIVNMLVAGWVVIICDRRKFKDYRMFEGRAQLVDTTEPDALLGTLQMLVKEHRQRDEVVGRAGAGNIAEVGGYRRYGVVVDEFGTQMMYAQREGVYEAITNELFTLAAEAASSGIHLWIADQKPLAKLWDDHVRANTGLVLTGHMPHGSGQSAGNYHAYQLQPHEFSVNGGEHVIKTWPVRENWTHYQSVMPRAGGVRVVDVPPRPSRQTPPAPASAPSADGDGLTDLQRDALLWLDNHAARVGVANVRAKHLEKAFSGRMDRSYAWKIFDAWRKGKAREYRGPVRAS